MIPLRLDQVPAQMPDTQILIYAVPVKLELLDTVSLAGKVVVEANYKDPCLQERCAAEGVTYISGMEWLTAQAVAGYELMTGIQPDAERVKACCAQ